MLMLPEFEGAPPWRFGVHSTLFKAGHPLSTGAERLVPMFLVMH